MAKIWCLQELENKSKPVHANLLDFLQLLDKCTVQVFTVNSYFDKANPAEDLVVHQFQNPVLLEIMSPINRYRIVHKLGKRGKLNITKFPTNWLTEKSYSSKTKCHIVVVDIVQLTTSHYSKKTEKNEVLVEILAGMSRLREDPNYVVLLDTNLQWEDNLSQFNATHWNLFFHYYPDLTITSVLLVSMGQTKNLSILCYSCTRNVFVNRAEMLFPIDFVGMDTVSKIYRTLAQNLNGLSILHDSLPYGSKSVERFLSPGCSMLKNGVFTYEDRCVAGVLSGKFNYTVIISTRRHHFVGSASSHLLANQYIVSQYFFGEATTFRMAWVGVGTVYTDFKFQVFATYANTAWVALIAPFNGVTWIVIGATGFVTVGVIWWAGRFKRKGDIFIVLFWTIVSLLEESSAVMKALRRIVVKKYFPGFAIITGIWLLFGNLFGILYKGDMFTSLATKVLPTVPETWNDLLLGRERVPIVTSSTIDFHELDTNIRDKQASTMERLVVFEMLKIFPRESKMFKMVTSLKKRLLFFAHSQLEIALNSTNSQYLERKGNTSWIKLPQIFAVIDEHADLSILRRGFHVLGKYSGIPNLEMSLYTGRKPWFVKRNFFLKTFSRGLTALVESGIYYGWIESYRHYGLLHQVRWYVQNREYLRGELRNLPYL
ncbi:hypothetical protein Fcan01_10332 [Folsomia candida]|uniref:Uncharacterized protein n=1 Tax=Folsomia candida TaxID=158441 RepID=A0A226EB95_FOLCA|nr:hypothetical protein Fcan01_10332 [Folsomia candida]